MTEELGTVRADGDRAALRFERRYDATLDEVWSALTEPESIRRWLHAEAVVEHEVGGAFRLVWSEDERAGGSVLAWEPPNVLEVEWAETEMRSILRIELSPAQGGTALVLDHRNVGLESAIGMGAGWHAHLEALGDLLEGRDADADRWRPRFESLLPRYAELVSSR